MAELADAPDLGSGISDVQVQVLLPVPYLNRRFNKIGGWDFFFEKPLIYKAFLHLTE